MSENYEELTVDGIRNDIIRFKNDPVAQQLDSYYNTRSIGEIFGVSRKEVPHSNFIAWLLTNNESHNLGSFPFLKFLEILVISSNERQSADHKTLFDSIITGDITVHELNTVTEKNITNVGRVDILIETDITFFDQDARLRIVVENKVGSKEHSDQTSKYFNYYQGLNERDVINLYVFLTPISGIKLADLEEPECSCKEYIQTNYQALVDYLLEPTLNRDISDKTRFIIKEYLQSLSQPAQTDEEEYKQGVIMAIGNEERELLTRFWEQNQKLIMSALYAISSDPDQDKDVRDNINNALESISGNTKDMSLVTIKFDGEVYVSNIRKTDIGFHTVRLIEEKGLLDDATFQFLKEDKSSSHCLIKSKDEMRDSELKYRRYNLKNEPAVIKSGIEYYACKNWGISNISKLIEKIEARFPKIEYITG